MLIFHSGKCKPKNHFRQVETEPLDILDGFPLKHNGFWIRFEPKWKCDIAIRLNTHDGVGGGFSLYQGGRGSAGVRVEVESFQVDEIDQIQSGLQSETLEPVQLSSRLCA